MTNLYTLVYLSTASNAFTEQQLKEILTVSRKNNEAGNVTGVLAYCDGNILQVLEGEKDVLYMLFDKINKDPRHKDLIILQNRFIDKRDFNDWSMGFKTVSKAEFYELEGYFDLKRQASKPLASDGSVVKTILSDFIANNR